MSRSALIAAAAAASAMWLLAQSPKYGVGRTPAPEEIRAWDITIRPDGKGLPPGRGTVSAGKEVFTNRCARCHGASGEGRDSVALAGGAGTLTSPKPLKTVTSYWPYATTVFDYVRRAMPFDNPGTLTDDQVYSLTAFMLNLGGVVPADAVMDAKSLPKVEMPNRNGFVADPRPDTGKKK
jgi:cytochrome c